MTYSEVLEEARKCIGDKCKACPVCNGVACRNSIPGPGAKGSGTVAMRNFNAWQNIFVNMDTIYKNGSVDTSIEFFGKHFALPVLQVLSGASISTTARNSTICRTTTRCSRRAPTTESSVSQETA
ncbi:MAG: hypothetical protein IKP49_00670 [Treponema sp.]|nr:hypothetical protein [Treponema sp.]